MAWDSTRPVPWERLVREWVIYAAIMTVIFLLLFRGASTVGAVAGVLVSGPLYLALGFVLAKFGYQRKSMKEVRAARSAPRKETANNDRPDARPRPAPTRRTSQGLNRPPNRKKR